MTDQRSMTAERWHALQLAYDVLCDPMLDDAEARTGAQHHVGNVIAAVNRAASDEVQQRGGLASDDELAGGFYGRVASREERQQ